MLTKEIILQKLREIKPLLQERYGVTELALFGSYARDEQTAESDIDLMVAQPLPSFCAYSALYHFLQELFAGMKVEIVSNKGIRPQYFAFVKDDLIYA